MKNLAVSQKVVVQARFFRSRSEVFLLADIFWKKITSSFVHSASSTSAQRQTDGRTDERNGITRLVNLLMACWRRCAVLLRVWMRTYQTTKCSTVPARHRHSRAWSALRPDCVEPLSAVSCPRRLSCASAPMTCRPSSNSRSAPSVDRRLSSLRPTTMNS